MKRNTIRIILILGSFVIVGIIVIQTFWMQHAWSSNEKLFRQSVQIALQQVAKKLFEYNNIEPPIINPVSQISPGYFVVNSNSEIDPNVLEHYLITELNFRNINIGFEYGIYNCTNDEMVYGKYIGNDEKVRKNALDEVLPKYDDYVYYFGVNFPSRQRYIFNNLSILIFFSGILLIVIMFFTYSLFVIFKQRRLSEQQRDFINNMTHEFKTPISSINLSANVLLNPNIINDPKRLNTYADLIKQEAFRLNDQVEKVLNIASIEKLGKNLNIERIDAAILINEITNSLGNNNENTEIEIKNDAFHSIINADKVHFTNIIFNLVDNAIKYSDKNPCVSIVTSNRDKQYVIAISDKGKGISKENQNKVFKKFYRVPTGNVHDVKGFGLGLYYVKSICKLHKWKIYLKSELKKGSVFTIFIPALIE